MCNPLVSKGQSSFRSITCNIGIESEEAILWRDQSFAGTDLGVYWSKNCTIVIHSSQSRHEYSWPQSAQNLRGCDHDTDHVIYHPAHNPGVHSAMAAYRCCCNPKLKFRYWHCRTLSWLGSLQWAQDIWAKCHSLKALPPSSHHCTGTCIWSWALSFPEYLTHQRGASQIFFNLNHLLQQEQLYCLLLSIQIGIS